MLSFGKTGWVVSLRRDDYLRALFVSTFMSPGNTDSITTQMNADQVSQPGMHLRRQAQAAALFLHLLCIQAVMRGLIAAEALAHALLLPAQGSHICADECFEK